MTKKFFVKKSKKVSKDAEFYADFKSAEKVLKNAPKRERKYLLFPLLLMFVKHVMINYKCSDFGMVSCENFVCMSLPTFL